MEEKEESVCVQRKRREQSNFASSISGSKQHPSFTAWKSCAEDLHRPALAKRPPAAQLSFCQGSSLANQTDSPASAPGGREVPAVREHTARRRQSPMSLPDNAARLQFRRVERKPVIESYAAQATRRGILQAVRGAGKDSYTAVGRSQAPNKYMPSLASSETLHPTTSEETLREVHLDDKTSPSGGDWTPVLSGSTVPAEMPVRKPFSASAVAERSALRNQPSKWLSTGLWPLAKKKVTMPSQRDGQNSAIHMTIIPRQYVNAEARHPHQHAKQLATDSEYSTADELSSSDNTKWKNVKSLPEKVTTVISGARYKKHLGTIPPGHKKYPPHSFDQTFSPASPAPQRAARLNRPSSERELVMSRKVKLPDSTWCSTVSNSSFTASERLHSTEDSTPAKHECSQCSTSLNAISRTSISPPTALQRARNAATDNYRKLRQRIASADNYRKLRQLMCGEHGLYLVAACCAIALIVVLSILFWPSKTRVGPSPRAALKRSDGSCSSLSCLRNLSHPTVLTTWSDGRPCEDFYMFVCSHWASQLPFPLNSSLSTDDDYVAVLENLIYVSLESERHKSSILQPLKVLHDECMDVANIEHRGLEALHSLLPDVSLQGFPFTTPIQDHMSVWAIAGQLLRKTGTSALLSVSFVPNPANKTENIVSVRHPELLSASGLVDTREVVRLYTAAVFLAIRIFQKDDIPPAEILAVVKFAADIEKLDPSWPKSNFVSIDPLSSRPEIMEFVKEVFLDAATMSGTISDLLVWSSGFTHELLDLAGDTDSHVALNYIGIRLLIQISPFLPYSELKDLFSAFVYGKTTTEPSRWQLCVRVVDRALYPLVHASLFAHVKLRASKSSLNRFVRVIVDEFRSEIDSSLFFDSSSKSAIRTIISSSVLSTIGPSWPENEATVRDYVEKLPEVRPTQSGLEVFVAYYQHTFLYSLTHGSQGQWHRSTFSTNCWYEVNPRTIHVPLLAFNVTQIFTDGTVTDIQASRVGPRLSRCLFDMLLEEANYANGTTKQWLSDDTWKNLLTVEACFEGRQDFLRLGRFRDVLAVQVALNVFEKNASSVEKLVVRLPDGRVLSGVQAFFAYLMLQSCKKSAGPRADGKSSANDEWSTVFRNNDRFRNAFSCPRRVDSMPTIKCPGYL